MNPRQGPQKNSEISMSEKKTPNRPEVILTIDNNQETRKGFTRSKPPTPSPRNPVATMDAAMKKMSFSRSSQYSRSNSRFPPQAYSIDSTVLEEERVGRGDSPYRSPGYVATPDNNKCMSSSTPRDVPITPRNPLMASPGPAGGDNDDDDAVYKKVTLELSKEKHRRVKTKTLVEWVVFGTLLGCLIASLTVEELQKAVLWSLELWQWCLLVIIIFSGMFVTNWIMNLVVFLIERNFLLRKKVLYFVHGLKHSVQFFIWLSLVLFTWVLLFRHELNQSELCNKVLNYVTWSLVSILTGSFLWFLKTLFLKVLASKFHVKTFFDRIQESIFHHYVLQTLSGQPLIEQAEKVGKEPSSSQFSFRTAKKGKAGKEKKVIDMSKIHKMKKEKVTAWTMKMLIDAVTNSGLSTISNELDETMENREAEQEDEEITNEMQAMDAAYRIFKNVSQHDHKYIEEDDLRRFMIPEEVALILPLFEGIAETGKIDLKALTNWVVKVYQGRRALAHALTDMKTAVRQLNKVLTGVLVVVTVVIWLLLTEIASTKVLIVLSTQLLALGFIFKSTCKSIFESIVFVFIIHPFDVGDRCVVDGVPLLVEEMNILSTVFMKLNSEKVYYPNSVLAKKPISNYLRSPEMGDSVHFSIDFRTTLERIGALKERIKKYLEEKPQHWFENHSVVVDEIYNLNQINMSLYVNHTINFQDFGEKNKRRSELVLELKKIFEELEIQYNLLPQQIHLVNKDKEASAEGRPLDH